MADRHADAGVVGRDARCTHGRRDEVARRFGQMQVLEAERKLARCEAETG